MTTYSLPPGFTAQPAVMEDLQAVVDLLNADMIEQYGAPDMTLEDLRLQWEAPIFHLERDSLVVRNPAQEIVGYAEFWDQKEGHVVYQVYAATHPQYRGQGLGGLLLDWCQERGLANMPLAEEGTRVVLRQYALDRNPSAYALFSAHGWRHIRDSYRMEIDLNRPVDAPVALQGIVIRSVENETDQCNALFAAYDSFLDHWGAIEEPFETYYQRHKYMADNDVHYDPSLWYMALEGETVVGISLCYGYLVEDPGLGWVGTLGVRRAWRKRGLGQALLQHSFAEFARRGYRRVGLGVDASSLTGATRVYERAGMRVTRQYHLFEHELRAGKDLTRQAPEEEKSLKEFGEEIPS